MIAADLCRIESQIFVVWIALSIWKCVGEIYSGCIPVGPVGTGWGEGGERNNSSIANWMTYIWVDAVVVILFLETPNMLLKVGLLQSGGLEGEEQSKVTNSVAVKAL
jgi:hypothetical protein